MSQYPQDSQYPSDPYGQPSADPYGQPSADPYAQPSADPYGQPSADPYAQYGQPADPYAQQYGAQPGYGAPGYGMPGQAPALMPQQGAPFGVDPRTGLPYSEKTKLAAGLLGIFLGFFGAGRFYTGHTSLGVAQLLVSIVTFGFGSIWGLIDGIIMLTSDSKDAQGFPLRP